MTIQIILAIFLATIAIFMGWLFIASRKAKKNIGQEFSAIQEIEEIKDSSAKEYYLVFTTPHCSICKKLKEKLIQQSIAFYEIPALKYPAIVQSLNIAGAPTTFKMDKKNIVDVYIGDWL